MGCEVDFLPVGDGKRSGDAIAVRYGNLFGEREEQTVVVVDGGFQASGEALVEHINNYYDTNTVDIVVSTHPDADHTSGLSEVLEKMDVGQLWMHKPWEHADEIANSLADRRFTERGISQKLARALEDARDLEKIANRKGIPIIEPFAGLTDGTGCLSVIGPTEEYYESLLPDFRSTGVQKAAAEATFMSRVLEAGIGLLAKVAESWGVETLTDDGETSAENNSSVILRLTVEDRNLLLTGDAGMPALTNAADWMEFILGVAPAEWWAMQVPHHGSKRNVGPTILNRIVGPKLNTPASNICAFVSACKDGEPKHPAKKVTNAYLRRGAPVHATKGSTKHYGFGAPDRGWSTSVPLPFYDEVDE